MDDDLRDRSDIAAEFVKRLEALTPDEWCALVGRHHPDDSYYRLALELVAEATQLLGERVRTAYEATLAEHTARAEALMARLESSADAAVTPAAVALVRAAIHALLLRDRYGFSAGAFGELVRPFRAFVDVRELERRATPRQTAVLVPPPPAFRAPPAGSR